MKYTYTNRPIIAEQFTDECTPNGVMVADDALIQKVLMPSLHEEAIKTGVFMFKFPKPSETDWAVAKSFGVNIPFQWIHKGDYVLEFPSGYSRVESKEIFEGEYYKVELQ